MHNVELKSKTEILYEKISDLAHRLGPGARMPRVLEMCDRFNVAPNTLNQALGEVERLGLITRRRGSGIYVSEHTRQWVDHAPLALICRPSAFRTAGHSPVWELLIEMIQARAERSGAAFDCYFSREVGVTPPLSTAVATAVKEHHFGGVFGVALPEDAVRWIMLQNVPVVNLFGPGHATIFIDMSEMVRLAAQELIRQGCRRIALWAPLQPVHTPEALRRQKQFLGDPLRDTLRENGLKFHTTLFVDNARWLKNLAELPTSTQQGYDVAREVFEKPRETWPDGVIVSDDIMTRGVLSALRHLNLQAGHDVKIASQANRGTDVLLNEDSIVRVEFDPEEIVATMFERMENLLRKTPEQLKDEATQSVIAPHLHTPAA